MKSNNDAVFEREGLDVIEHVPESGLATMELKRLASN